MSTCLFQTKWGNEKMLECTCTHVHHGCLWERHLLICYNCNPNETFFKDYHLCLKERMENHGHSDLSHWQTCSQKLSRWAWEVKENNWHYLLPMVTFNTEIRILENMYAIINLPVSLYLRSFLMRCVGVLMKVIFWCYIKKYVNT